MERSYLGYSIHTWSIHDIRYHGHKDVIRLMSLFGRESNSSQGIIICLLRRKVPKMEQRMHVIFSRKSERPLGNKELTCVTLRFNMLTITITTKGKEKSVLRIKDKAAWRRCRKILGLKIKKIMNSRKVKKRQENEISYFQLQIIENVDELWNQWNKLGLWWLSRMSTHARLARIIHCNY